MNLVLETRCDTSHAPIHLSRVEGPYGWWDVSIVVVSLWLIVQRCRG